MTLKELIKILTPPVLRDLFWRLPTSNLIFNFKYFYKKKIKNNKDLPKDLIDVTDKFISSPSYKMVSNFWNYINILHYRLIVKEKGIDKYSSTVGKYYYNFSSLPEEGVSNTLKLLEHENIKINAKIFKKHNNYSYSESFFNNCILLLLYESLKKTSSINLLERLKDDSFLGFDDAYLEIDNIKITHDKINSLLDYDRIKNINYFKNFKTVLEIGAGSGRTSEVIINFHSNFKYIICDIPPAIYISYKRLKKVFPKKKIKLLFDISDYENIKNEIKNNDICFIFPHQLEFFKEKLFDLVIAIGCMQEMDKASLKYYFKIIDQSSDYFYMSTIEKTLVPYSFNRLNFEKNDYPISKKWSLIFKKKSIYPSNYVNVCYKLI
jgi:putative sugar O-methyltransferase